MILELIAPDELEELVKSGAWKKRTDPSALSGWAEESDVNGTSVAVCCEGGNVGVNSSCSTSEGESAGSSAASNDESAEEGGSRSDDGHGNSSVSALGLATGGPLASVESGTPCIWVASCVTAVESGTPCVESCATTDAVVSPLSVVIVFGLCTPTSSGTADDS